MDEPLSNLDAKLRVEMRNVIKRIQNEVGITTVYVTHDQEEALAISDRIAVMYDGVIQQIGTPQHIYQRPANEFVSGFIGLSNFIDASYQNGTVDFGSFYRVPIQLCNEAGSEVRAAIRPEEFTIRPKSETGIPATINSSVFLGMTIHYFATLNSNGQEVEIVAPADTNAVLQSGDEVSLNVAAHKINIFDRKTKKTLIPEGA